MLSPYPRCPSPLPHLFAVAEEPAPYEAAAEVHTGPGKRRPPVELDALELHRRIVGFQRLSDRSRFELLKLLAILDDGRRYLELGYSSSKHYVVKELSVGRSNALELVRVARRLRELPRLAAALKGGDIRWSTLQLVSRVATPETEAEWLDFATTHTFEQTVHEVKRAIAERRDRPASGSDYGLTNVMTRVSFELTLEEKERFMTAMARVTEEMGNGAPTDLASTLTFLSQRILEGQPIVAPAGVQNLDGEPAPAAVHNLDGADVGNGSDGRPGAAVATGPARAPGLTVVYHQYADQVTTVDTPDGPVRVAPEVVDRIADVARSVTLTAEDMAAAEPLPDGEVDHPNSSALASKVRKRDGERCANPGCGTRHNLQAHHIHHRARGGRSVMSNEAAVCRTCHTLVHAGLLEVERTPTGEIRWRPRARAAGVEREMEPFPAMVDLMPSVELPAPPATAVDIDVDELVDGLASLGFTKQSARRRLDLALARLGAGADSAIDEAIVMREALRTGAC